MRSEREGWNERTMIKVLMNLIPDSKSDAQEDAILPSTVWKEMILSSFNDSLSGQSLNEIKKDISNVFGSKGQYSLMDKSKLLDSVTIPKKNMTKRLAS